MPARSSLMPALVAFVAGATGTTGTVRAQHAAPPPEPGSFALPTQPPGRDEAERRHEHLVHEPAGDADFRDTVDDIFQNTFDSRDHARRILRRTRAI